jgi:hypothetical protein
MQPATDNNLQFIHKTGQTTIKHNWGRETMQHPTKAAQQAKTLIDGTTQIELVEQANTLIINLYIDTVQSNTLLHN